MSGLRHGAAVLSVVLLLCGGRPAYAQLLVFAAASLKNALDDVNAAYSPDARARPRVSYAASSMLAQQIERGAPVAVFVSADLAWMEHLEQRGLLVSGSRRNLLGNSLVLIASATAATPDAAAATLMRDAPLARWLRQHGRLALADPAHVPAGRYARAALEHLGLWSGVADRLAPSDNVRTALAHVARGEAPLGIVYRSDALAEPRVRVVAHISPGTHPDIVYPAARVRGSGEDARRYLEFLASELARARFERHGFTRR